MKRNTETSAFRMKPDPRIIAAEKYFSAPNILRGTQPPVNPYREIEQMLCSVTPRRIVTPEANRFLGRPRRV